MSPATLTLHWPKRPMPYRVRSVGCERLATVVAPLVPKRLAVA